LEEPNADLTHIGFSHYLLAFTTNTTNLGLPGLWLSGNIGSFMDILNKKINMAHKAGNHCNVEAKRMTYLLLKTFKLLLVFSHFSF
jgi:hypothetical protein